MRAVKNHDIAQAKRLFPTARAHYERIEPVAKQLGTLDPLIDGPVADASAQQVGGFHRIELQLWQVGQVAGTEWIADALLTNVTRLQEGVPDLTLSPATLAGGAAALVDEMATHKITGEEDRFSHTDLWDFEANLEGVEQAIGALRPLIAAKDRPLLANITHRLSAAKAELTKYRKVPGFVAYTNLGKTDTRALGAKFERAGRGARQGRAARPLIPDFGREDDPAHASRVDVWFT